jgi:phage gp37-like protein
MKVGMSAFLPRTQFSYIHNRLSSLPAVWVSWSGPNNKAAIYQGLIAKMVIAKHK